MKTLFKLFNAYDGSFGENSPVRCVVEDCDDIDGIDDLIETEDIELLIRFLAVGSRRELYSSFSSEELDRLIYIDKKLDIIPVAKHVPRRGCHISKYELKKAVKYIFRPLNLELTEVQIMTCCGYLMGVVNGLKGNFIPIDSTKDMIIHLHSMLDLIEIEIVVNNAFSGVIANLWVPDRIYSTLLKLCNLSVLEWQHKI